MASCSRSSFSQSFLYTAKPRAQAHLANQIKLIKLIKLIRADQASINLAQRSTWVALCPGFRWSARCWAQVWPR